MTPKQAKEFLDKWLPTQPPVVKEAMDVLMAVSPEELSPEELAYFVYAKNNMHVDGEIEFDDLRTRLPWPTRPVSLSTNGAYVQGWVWVDDEMVQP